MRYLVKGLMVVLLVSGTGATARVGINENLADPNLIDADELQSLPHVNESLAAAVEAGRPYLDAMQLDAVLADSLDEAQRANLYGSLFRQINLNAAPESEILMIPGMSKRMAHEFDEYRPYSSLEQFRREIGKYVDAEEVARLEQYVFIPMNLNTAPLEDFATIPGMTPRMVHEFEEYRPYTSMEQFRREIGKYVDEDEVARLESYVTLD
jgi:DNA uptake protein ComE-like DNA-binding protein